MRDVFAVLVALFICPIIPGLALSLGTPIHRSSSLDFSFGLLIVGYFFGLLAMIFLAIPAFSLLRYLNLVRWWTTAITGILGGMVGAYLLRYPNKLQLNDLVITCGIGFAMSMVFWLIWYRCIHTGQLVSTD